MVVMIALSSLSLRDTQRHTETARWFWKQSGTASRLAGSKQVSQPLHDNEACSKRGAAIPEV